MSKITSDLSNLDCTIEILLGNFSKINAVKKKIPIAHLKLKHIRQRKKKSKQITKQWSEKIEKETLMMLREYLNAARRRHMKVWDHLRL